MEEYRRPNRTHDESARPMTDRRPLFFSNLVALDTNAHRGLRLAAKRKSFAYAGQANLVPLTVADVAPALRDYPVVFVTDGDVPTLVAVLSLKPGSNRFVDADGHWRPGAYVPAYVRSYPFIAVRTEGKSDPVLALDPGADAFKAEDGLPLFDADGKPTDSLRAIMAYQAEYQHLAERTRSMAKALEAAGVLEESVLQIQPPGGGEMQKVAGFRVVSEQKLRALPAEALGKLHEADALGLAYAQMFSMGSLGNLFAESAAAAAPAPAPASPRGRKAKKKAE